MSLVGIIPAKGHSVGIPGKNLIDVGGKPLLAWTVEACKKACSQVFVSTEDSTVAEVAQEYGAYVIERPTTLCHDNVHSISVILHAINKLELKPFDKVGMFFPTSPLRTSFDIIKATSLLYGSYDSIVSITQISPRNSLRDKDKNGYGIKPTISDYGLHQQRQEVEPLYAVNGAIFISTVQTLLQHKSFHTQNQGCYIMPKSRSLDINDQDDLEVARKLI